jgi:hypothetical protein
MEPQEIATFPFKLAQSHTNGVRLLEQQRIDPGG